MNSSRKVVVITGCSSGFGEGAVRAFADKGYRVWGTLRGARGRNAAKKAALEAYSSRVSVFDMDVTDDASVAAAFAHILSQGPVDVLINNAGVGYHNELEDTSIETWKKLIDVNLNLHKYGIKKLKIKYPEKSLLIESYEKYLPEFNFNNLDFLGFYASLIFRQRKIICDRLLDESDFLGLSQIKRK